MSNDVSLDINQESNPVQAVAPPKEDNNMLRATDKITALYCRLSVEDTKEKGGKDDPSNSIQHQQIMLMEYAKSQHFPNPTFFIDDGYSGVEFSNRPGFQKMLAEIEAGHVEVVITKDLSRLGRNSSLTGLYINYTFPQYGVRYIAINDHFDTIDPNSTDSDMAGIKNWFNEWYAKDTSRKIRAVNKAKGERGERLTTNVPYGYKRDSDDPKKWVIDEEAAQVVKRIFALCMEGKGPSQIAALLEKGHIQNPTAYKQREGRKTPHQTPENEYRWHESTVAYILEYMEYTGCTVNFKTYTNSIWDKKQRETPVEKQEVAEALLDQEVDLVAERFGRNGHLFIGVRVAENVVVPVEVGVVHFALFEVRLVDLVGRPVGFFHAGAVDDVFQAAAVERGALAGFAEIELGDQPRRTVDLNLQTLFQVGRTKHCWTLLRNSEFYK